jgi:hypothetical protein
MLSEADSTHQLLVWSLLLVNCGSQGKCDPGKRRENHGDDMKPLITEPVRVCRLLSAIALRGTHVTTHRRDSVAKCKAS